MTDKYREIEARFLDIDYKNLVSKLNALGARDLGKDLIEELIFYDKDLTWKKRQIYVRLRNAKGKTYLTYKHHQKATVDGTLELEFEVEDFEKAKKFLEQLGLIAYRTQEKKRHKFILGNVVLDIDTWPKIPTYLEIEGKSEKDIRDVVSKLEMDFSKAVFIDARGIIEKVYNIPVSNYRYFTFKRVGLPTS